ncbi:MAG: ankyrin repeat domain-containing protein, partial [Bacteroidota bacterium]
VNAILAGNIVLLKELINESPKLTEAHSQYGHAATLLHYVASNGVELWRQKVPFNLVEITEYLLACGADRQAKMKVYGGQFDTLSLLQTSEHPKQFGLLDQMEDLLLKKNVI